MRLSDMSPVHSKTTAWQPFDVEFVDAAAGSRAFVELEDATRPTEDFVPLHADDADDDAPAGAVSDPPDLADCTSRIEQDAYEKGFAQGQKNGQELGKEIAQQNIDRLSDLLQEMAGLKQTLLKQHEQDIAALVLAIAEAVIHCPLGDRESAIKEAVHRSLAVLPNPPEVRIFIHPDDAEIVDSLRPGLFAEMKGLKSVTVASDPTITRGGCRMESPAGAVDASLETRFASIRQAVQEVLCQGDGA